jgi:Ca2+:H+ antiporter
MYTSMMLIAVVSMSVPGTFNRLFGAGDLGEHEQSLNIGLAVVLLLTYALYLVFMLKTHPEVFASPKVNNEVEEHEEHWSLGRALVTLVVASVLAAWMSEILVGAAEGTGEALGMTPTFIGLVFLAVVGGAAESLSAITMARKNKMDLTLGIALGSCIQIALFIAPLLVLLSLVIGPGPMPLTFGRTELGSLFLAVLIGAIVSGDGRSNWYKGVQLTMVYIIIALLFYFMPA